MQSQSTSTYNQTFSNSEFKEKILDYALYLIEELIKMNHAGASFELIQELCNKHFYAQEQTYMTYCISK